jgi:hypothetical protein
MRGYPENRPQSDDWLDGRVKPGHDKAAAEGASLPLTKANSFKSRQSCAAARPILTFFSSATSGEGWNEATD